jgi:hypothetical protein
MCRASVDGWPARLSSVPVPPADRVSQPGRIQVFRQCSSVQKDLAELLLGFVENHYQFRLLDNLERVATAPRSVENRNTRRQTVRRSILAVVGSSHSFLSKCLRPGLDGKLAGLEITSEI